MNSKIRLIIIFSFCTSTLFAQSKKELNLRIDSLCTQLNNEKQVAQNLTQQILDRTIELEKLNTTMIDLTTQITKQDSLNMLIYSEIQKLNIKAIDFQREQDSIKSIAITPPVVKANLKMKLFSKYVDGKGKIFINEMKKLSAEYNYYFICYDSPRGVDEVEKIQIEGLGDNLSITITDSSSEEGKVLYEKSNIQINGVFIIPNKYIKNDMGLNFVISVKQNGVIITEETIQFIGCN